MRAARAIAVVIFSFLLFVACSTTRKATTMEDVTTRLTETADSSAGHRETGAAFLQQQTTSEGTDAANITITFERWEFTPAPYTGALADSTRASPDVNTCYRKEEKPPDTRLASYTKGAINITREGAQRRSTLTTAGATVEIADTTATKSNIDQETKTKTTAKTETTQRNNTGLIVLIILAAAVYISYRFLSRRW